MGILQLAQVLMGMTPEAIAFFQSLGKSVKGGAEPTPEEMSAAQAHLDNSESRWRALLPPGE